MLKYKNVIKNVLRIYFFQGFLTFKYIQQDKKYMGESMQVRGKVKYIHDKKIAKGCEYLHSTQ